MTPGLVTAVCCEDHPAPHCSHARSRPLQVGRKRFTACGASGAYLRVLETGDVGAGDAVEVVSCTDHGVTVGLLFRATTTQQRRLPEIAPALDHLPLEDRRKLAARIKKRVAARTGAGAGA